MTEYGRIHTDGSRSGGQPIIKTQHCPNCEATEQKLHDFKQKASNALQADIDAMESILWVETIIDDQEAIAKTFARHRQYGYDQGYYDGQRDRQPTQEQSK